MVKCWVIISLLLPVRLSQKSFLEGNALLVGMPAVKKVDRPDYYLLFKGESKQRVDAIETLEIKMEFE